MPPACPASRWVGLTEHISLCGRLLRNHLAVQAEKAGLNEPQLSLLWACQAAGPEGIGQNDLAQRLLVSPAHVSGLVEQLRRKRLLAGRRDVADRRRQIWRLTARGRAELEHILAAVTEWATRLDQRLGTRSVDLLAGVLAQLTTALEPQAPRSLAAEGPEGAAA